jgi:hypothetical protein
MNPHRAIIELSFADRRRGGWRRERADIRRWKVVAPAASKVDAAIRAAIDKGSQRVR